MGHWFQNHYHSIYKEVPVSQLHPRCANTHNCLGPTLGKWWNTEVSLINAARLRLAQYCIAWISGSPCLMDPRGLRVTHNAYFSLLTHTKKLLLVTFCDPTAKTGVTFWTHTRTERNHEQTGARKGWNSSLDSNHMLSPWILIESWYQNTSSIFWQLEWPAWTLWMVLIARILFNLHFL